jgi:hypothetical protein
MLNLIKLVIDRAIERIVGLISREEVTREAADIAAGNIDPDALIDGVVAHERVARELFHNLTSRTVARHIDLSDLAQNLDHSDIVSEIDLSDLASNIDLGDLAGEIDLGDFAESLDYERLAAALDVDRLSDAVYTRVCVPEVEGLEARINEAISHGVANALDVANRRTEPVAPVVEQSPDLIARLLDLAVEKLLARADEAAKNGEV